jgi:hypothetical protein
MVWQRGPTGIGTPGSVEENVDGRAGVYRNSTDLPEWSLNVYLEGATRTTTEKPEGISSPPPTAVRERVNSL